MYAYSTLLLDILFCIFFSLGEGTTSTNSLPTLIIAVATAGNSFILLVGCILLVIGIILMVKRKRHTFTVQYTVDRDAQMYDEVGVVKCSAEANAYQELSITRMERPQQYADLK